MERARANGGGLAAEGQRVDLGYRRMVAPLVVLDACVLYMKKDMMIKTNGTSSAMNDKKSQPSHRLKRKGWWLEVDPT